jgi:hypothetical protein
MKSILILLLSLAAPLSGAEYALPAASSIDWTQTGVTGGVQQYVDARTTLLDVTASPYNANPAQPETTGSVAAGGTALTVASPTDFRVNDFIRIEGGYPEVSTLVVTSGASVNGNVVVVLEGASTPVAILSTDSAADVATKLRAAAYSGWTASGTGVNVIWTSTTNNDRWGSLSVSSAPLGFASTVSTEQGATHGAHSITDINGSILTISPARTTSAAAAGAVVRTDTARSIQAAVNAATAGQVVYIPAATWRLDYAIRIADKDDITIRGAGPDATIFNYTYDNAPAFSFGGGYNYLWNYPALAITGSPAKGSTVLTVADSTNIISGMIAKLDMDNSLDYSLTAQLPVVINTASFLRSRQSMHKVVSKTPTTITISPPLAFPLPIEKNPRINGASQQCERSGLEDLMINAAGSISPQVVAFEQCLDTWVRNVEIRQANNYALYMTRCVRCSVEHCFIAESQGGGSNHSGQLTDYISFCRFENNIVTNWELCVQMNGSTGNVFGYNFYGQAVNMGFNTNHGAHCSFNLYEGNVLQSSQSDGYHGSGSQDVGFRNWYTADNDLDNGTWDASFTIVLNRFCRQYCFVGNVIGVSGHPSVYLGAEYIYSFGNPNMGNTAFTGTASPSTGDVWETITTGEYPWTPPGTRAATTFQEKDLDVEPSTLRVHNWSPSVGGGSIIAGEALPGGDTLPNSLYLTIAPDFMAGYTWPPFNPNAPSSALNQIPATARFFAESPPPPAPPRLRLQKDIKRSILMSR